MVAAVGVPSVDAVVATIEWVVEDTEVDVVVWPLMEFCWKLGSPEGGGGGGGLGSLGGWLLEIIQHTMGW